MSPWKNSRARDPSMPHSEADERRLQFESLALPFMQALYNTALRLMADAEDAAADVLQETYLRAYLTFDNFRPNDWRRLKTETFFRAVRLWPQLEAILRPYVFNTNGPPSRLLFPSYRTGQEAMLTDFRKLLDAVAVRAISDYCWVTAATAGKFPADAR